MDYNLTTTEVVLLLVVIVWDLAWKGLGLWRAGHNNDLVWFIFILLINSVGILPIIYVLTHQAPKTK